MMKIHTIDLNFQGVEGVVAAFLLESNGELALIETGPTSTLAALRVGIEELGYPVADHLECYRVAVKAATDFVGQRIAEGADADVVQILYEAFQMEQAFKAGVPPEVWADYQVANPTGMCADGLRMYHERLAVD